MERQKQAIKLLFVVIAFAGIVISIGYSSRRKPSIAANRLAFAPTTARLERGRYIVEGPAHCFQCHSEVDWKNPGAQPIAATCSLTIAAGSTRTGRRSAATTRRAVASTTTVVSMTGISTRRSRSGNTPKRSCRRGGRRASGMGRAGTRSFRCWPRTEEPACRT